MNFILFSLPFGFVDSIFFSFERAKIQAAPWPDRDGKGGVVLLGDQSFCSSDTLRSMRGVSLSSSLMRVYLSSSDQWSKPYNFQSLEEKG
ncbi:hypothetical protein KFK09_008055 [Dendrobium nobile]|uniref:Uncharacterized protein n=1 Tax=Dendrobium nobile TaxID=94219 RepID=A0A8T3BW13_DENNO|nr:hypothetical protein KFK09_008055 [Dendrobium nobile]